MTFPLIYLYTISPCHQTGQISCVETEKKTIYARVYINTVLTFFYSSFIALLEKNASKRRIESNENYRDNDDDNDNDNDDDDDYDTRKASRFRDIQQR